MQQRRTQCFDPVYNKDSKILIVGSAPSVVSWEQGFYYAHPQNRFWKLMAMLCTCEEPQTVEEKKAMLLKNSIALWDVIDSCDIVGSADNSIKNVVENDFTKILAETQIQKIYANGSKALKIYENNIEPKIGTKAVGLPSTSPLNARYNMERLYKEWSIILEP